MRKINVFLFELESVNFKLVVIFIIISTLLVMNYVRNSCI